jgi:hypothetical protein
LGKLEKTWGNLVNQGRRIVSRRRHIPNLCKTLKGRGILGNMGRRPRGVRLFLTIKTLGKKSRHFTEMGGISGLKP